MINVPNSNLMDKICLSSFIYDQIENPIETLKSFFDYKDLQSHLKYLKQWRNVVETNAYFEIDTLNSPLFEHKMICNLINAAYLFSQTADEQIGKLRNLSAKEQEKYLNHECLSVNFYAKHLSTTELIDPFEGLKNFFETNPIQFYHQQLYEWLNIGLSPNVVITDQITTDCVYKNLRKLIECCWLIYNREREMLVDLATESSTRLNAEQNLKSVEEEQINEVALSSFKQFLAIVPPNRLNSGLRKMLIDYLFYNIDGLPIDFEELLTDFYWLTSFLDDIQGKEVDPKFM
jgi:hypothetical protein